MAIGVGSFVTGINDGESHYNWTNEHALMLVRELNPREDSMADDMTVCIVAADDGRHLGECVLVKSVFFEEVDPDEWLDGHGMSYSSWGVVRNFEQYLNEAKVLRGETPATTEVVDMASAEVRESHTIFDRENLIKESRQLLEHGFNGEEFDYPTTDKGVGTIIDTWHENKGNLESLLGRHPNWIPEKHYIAIPKSEFHRGIDKGKVSDFCDWAKQNIEPPKEKKITAWEYREACQLYKKADWCIDRIETINDKFIDDFDDYSFRKESVLIKGKGIDEWKEERSFFRSICRMYDNDPTIVLDCASAYDVDERNRYYWKTYFFNAIEDFVKRKGISVATKEICDKVNDLATKLDIKLDAVPDQKISRIVGKFCKAIGLDKIVKMGTTHSGREKDYGYNYQYAVFSDAINVLTFNQTLVVSVNPIDYWTMSFGNSWQSCHTIDKWGKRKASHEDDAHNYSGCYSSGTESYMLDGVSMIVYTVDSKYDGGSLDNLEKANKMKRCVFCYGEDKLIQSRVYPDGRNNSEHGIEDNGFATELRQMVQKIFADCLGVPNLWVLKRGMNACERVTESYGTHYRDYTEYDDGSVSYLKKREINYDPIKIGHDPICPNCGEEHSESEWITCEDCQHVGQVRCERCGDWIDEDQAIRCEETGSYYCDGDCANSDGVYYCEDDELWHTEDNCHRSDATGDYFYDDDDMIIAEDGNVYMNADEAETEGYLPDYMGNWYPKDEFKICPICGRLVHPNDWDDGAGCCDECAESAAMESEVNHEGVA